MPWGRMAVRPYRGDNMNIALDVMGGDYAPREILLGAIQATRTLGVNLILVGPQATIQECLKAEQQDIQVPSFEIVDAPDVVSFHENPSSVRDRPGASIRVMCDLVRDGRADACVSMGNTGAGVMAGLVAFGRLSGARRPCIAVPYFSLQPDTLMLDVGAIVDCKPEHHVQFARMGSVYAEKIMGISRPSVAIMANGREENKGNELTRAAFALLKQTDLNFIGNVEGYDLPFGTANVIVMDGLWGNIALKLSEALGEELLGRMAQRFIQENLIEATPVLTEFRQMMDYSRIGAMPVLGVDGLILIGHGRSRAPAVVGGIRTAMRAVEVDLLGALRAGLQK